MNKKDKLLKNLDKIKELLDDPDFIKGFQESYQKEMDKRFDYYQTESFNQHLNTIKEYLNNNKDLDTEDLKYNTELCNKTNLDQESLWKVYGAIESNHPSLIKSVESDFESTELIYQDIIWTVVHGQGSLLHLRKK